MTQTLPPPAKKAAPPPPSSGKPDVPKEPTSFRVTKTNLGTIGHRIVLYGVGGIGKTSLAALAPQPIFIDAERGAWALGLPHLEGVTNWNTLRQALNSDLWSDFKTIVIDTVTAVRGWAEEWTIANVPHEKGQNVTSIEGYGFGKGYQHVFDTFRLLLADLDRHCLAGRNVILVAHSVVERAPNPVSDDYIRNEPDLPNPPKQGRIRDLVKNWSDHMLFVSYDLSVNRDGKAIGSGTRTIYTAELPTHWAKSRTLAPEPIPFPKNSRELWTKLFGENHAK